MSNSYVKPRKQKERLEKRIKNYERMESQYKGHGTSPYTKPGSMNK